MRRQKSEASGSTAVGSSRKLRDVRYKREERREHVLRFVYSYAVFGGEKWLPHESVLFYLRHQYLSHDRARGVMGYLRYLPIPSSVFQTSSKQPQYYLESTYRSPFVISCVACHAALLPFCIGPFFLSLRIFH